jgi:hypothetical protein
MTGTAIVHALLDAQPLTPAEFMTSFSQTNRVGLKFSSIYGDPDMEGDNTFSVEETFLDGRKVFLGFVEHQDGSWYTKSLASNKAIGRGEREGAHYSRGPYGTRGEAANVLRDDFQTYRNP